jgi:hypothetical protein
MCCKWKDYSFDGREKLTRNIKQYYFITHRGPGCPAFTDSNERGKKKKR